LFELWRNAVTSRVADLRGYRVELYVDPEDGSWAVEVPDLPGCVAAADTPSDAVAAAEDAIAAWIEAAIADGERVPAPSPVIDEFSGRFVLRVAKGLHRELARQAKNDGVSLNTYCSNALVRAVTAAQYGEAWSTHSRPTLTEWPWMSSLAPTFERLFVHRAGAVTGESTTAWREWRLPTPAQEAVHVSGALKVT
jgi:antitoxin HicB